MFLDRLLDRAASGAPVVENVGSPAAELDHPAWGPVREPEDQPAEAEPAEARADAPRAGTVRRRLAAVLLPLPEAGEAAAEVEASPRRPPPIPRRGTDVAAARAAAALPDPAPHAASSPRSRPELPAPPAGPAAPQTPAPARPSRTAPPSDHPAPPMPGVVPALAAMHDDGAETVEFYLDIGRIDLVEASGVDAGSRPAPLPSRQARPGPLLTLTDYLAARRGGRG